MTGHARPIDLATTEAHDARFAITVAREHLVYRQAQGLGPKWILLEVGLDPTRYETPREIEDAIAEVWINLPAVTGDGG